MWLRILKYVLAFLKLFAPKQVYYELCEMGISDVVNFIYYWCACLAPGHPYFEMPLLSEIFLTYYVNSILECRRVDMYDYDSADMHI